MEEDHKRFIMLCTKGLKTLPALTGPNQAPVYKSATYNVARVTLKDNINYTIGHFRKAVWKAVIILVQLHDLMEALKRCYCISRLSMKHGAEKKAVLNGHEESVTALCHVTEKDRETLQVQIMGHEAVSVA